MAKKTNEREKTWQDNIRQLVLNGTLKFPEFTDEARARSKYPTDKPRCTFSFPKNEYNDVAAQMINEYHAFAGGAKPLVQDGDKLEKDYERGNWIVKLKGGRSSKFVDTDKQAVPLEVFESFDDVRVQVSPYNYGEGISLYIQWMMLTGKSSIASIPDFDGEQGYKLSQDLPPALRSNRQTSYVEDDEDEDDVPFVATSTRNSTADILSQIRGRRTA